MITTVEDRAILCDIIAEALGVEATNYTANTVIAVLPEDIISSAIENGFSDTEVRDSIFTFLIDHKEEALKYFTTYPSKMEIDSTGTARKGLEDWCAKRGDEILIKALSEQNPSGSEQR